MLSQMNYRKETQPHGDELFPLSIHVFETDLQSTVRVYCHWHEEVELFYAVKGAAVSCRCIPAAFSVRHIA